MMEQVLARENMLRAWQRVKSNAGAPGIDGMTVEAFPAFCREHWPRIRSALMEGTYRRNRGHRVKDVIDELRRYVTGWLNYFGISETYSQVVELAEWVRRRVRLYYWKQWKQPRTRRRHLLALGIPREEVHMA